MATFNRGKLAEYQEMLPALHLVSMDQTRAQGQPVESGHTFAENALIKARWAHSQTGMAVLADDSGLEIDGLGGRPGVLSARYAGEGATWAQLIAKVVEECAELDSDARRARFRCSLVLLVPGVMPALFNGTCEGRIVLAPRGDHGFGYDPIFELPDGHTMAELRAEEKNRISHRAVAVEALLASGLLERHGFLVTAPS